MAFTRTPSPLVCRTLSCFIGGWSLRTGRFLGSCRFLFLQGSRPFLLSFLPSLLRMSRFLSCLVLLLLLLAYHHVAFLGSFKLFLNLFLKRLLLLLLFFDLRAAIASCTVKNSGGAPHIRATLLPDTGVLPLLELLDWRVPIMMEFVVVLFCSKNVTRCRILVGSSTVSKIFLMCSAVCFSVWSSACAFSSSSKAITIGRNLSAKLR